MTYPISCPESSPTPSHMYILSMKTKPSFCFINGQFFKTKAFCFINQISLDDSRYQLEFLKFRVFMHLWAMDFQVYTTGHRTPFQHFYGLSPPMIMSNCEFLVFHPRGDLPQLAMPNTHIFIFKTMRLILDVIPCY